MCDMDNVESFGVDVFDVIDRLVYEEYVRGRGLSCLRMYKLLYYVQAIGLGVYGRRVFENDLEGWPIGPMVVEVFERYRGYGLGDLDVVLDPKDLGDDVNGLVSDVSIVFGEYEAFELENLVRSEDPWLVSREGLGVYDRGNVVLSDELICDYVRSSYLMN